MQPMRYCEMAVHHSAIIVVYIHTDWGGGEDSRNHCASFFLRGRLIDLNGKLERKKEQKELLCC